MTTKKDYKKASERRILHSFNFAENLRKFKGIVDSVIIVFWSFQLLLILIEDIVMSILKKSIYDENWAHDMYLNVCVCVMNFWAARNGKKLNFELFRPNLPQFGLFHPYFVCKCSFKEISW